MCKPQQIIWAAHTVDAQMWRMRQLLGNRQTHVYQPTIYEDKDWYYRGRPNFFGFTPPNSKFCFPEGSFLTNSAIIGSRYLVNPATVVGKRASFHWNCARKFAQYLPSICALYGIPCWERIVRWMLYLGVLLIPLFGYMWNIKKWWSRNENNRPCDNNKNKQK